MTWLTPPIYAGEPAKLVPQDAAVYVEVSDASRLVDRLLAPDIVRTLGSIDQFRQFTESNDFTQLRAVVTFLEARLGTTWRQAIGDLTGGGAVFAVKPGSPDYVLVMLRAKDPKLLHRTNDLLIELVENDAKDKGRESPVKSRDYKGVKAWSLDKNEFHTIVDDTIIFTNKQDGLKAVIEMAAGEGPRAITESATWKEARARQGEDRIGWAMVRLDMLRQAGVAKDIYQEKAADAGIPIFLGGLGRVLSRAEYATASLVLNDQRMALRFDVPRDGSDWPEAYRGFYAAKPGEEAAEPLRPAGTIASLSFYRDLKAMWDARDQLVTPEVLPQFTELENNLGNVLFGGREFANEVLGEFGPRFRVVAATQDYKRVKVAPDIKVPAFALVMELNHPDEFGKELLVSYQSLMGLVNLGLGQQNQPRFMVSTENYKGFPVHGARFLQRAAGEGDKGVHLRYNFSPAVTIAGRYFVVGSTVEIVQDVIDALGDTSAPPKTTPHNVIAEVNVARLIEVLEQNREPIVNQNIVDDGNTREQAEAEFGLALKLVGLLRKGQFTWTAEPKSMHVELSVDFEQGQKAAGK